MNPPNFVRSGSVPHHLLPPHIAAMVRPVAPAPPRPPAFRPISGPSRRVRVGLACPVLYPCGAESHMLSLVGSTDPARVEWVGLAVTGGASAREAGISARFAAAGLAPADGREAALDLAGACDVLVSWDIGDLPERVARAHPACRVVAISHSPPESDWGRRAMERTGGIARHVAVSELALGTIPETHRAGARVIWNAVDPSRMESTRGRAEMLANWGLPPDALVAGYYGRMSDEKDPHAMGRLAGWLPEPWRCVIVGPGHLRPEVERAAAESGGADRVHFFPPDPRAGDVLGAFDALIVPSEYESFGLTIAEGLWAGVPVVSTPVGIAKIRPGLTHQLPFDAGGEVLAAVVAEAYRSGPRLGSLEWAHGNLSPGRFGREWTDLILQLAAGPPARSPARKIGACPHRGSILPLSLQSDCGCGGKELTECRAGKGKVPGRVTTADCLACVG